MQVNQEQFLGHPNLFGNTISMQEVQRAQVELWSNTFTAAIREGKHSYSACEVADLAIKKFNERFVP